MMTSLLVSWYVYDLSGLYEFRWLNRLPVAEKANIWNIHAGLDESSSFLQARYPRARLRVMDFYHPKKHSEVSIKRARKIYPPHPAPIPMDIENFKNQWEAADWIFLLMSAHEIRTMEEHLRFFEHLQQALQPEGRVVVMEHLRDFPNFLAYTLGCLHFHSKKTWLATFRQAGFVVEEEWKETPFISIFILRKHGTTS